MQAELKARAKLVPLDKDQRDIAEAIISGIRAGKPQQTLCGFGGTGKTTILGHVMAELDGLLPCTFTGKAADMLRKKGADDAKTIHSTIYQPIEINGHVHFDLRSELDARALIVDEASMVGKVLDRDLKSFGIPIVYSGDDGQLEPIERDLNVLVDPDFRLTKLHRNAGEIARFAEWVRLEKPCRRFPFTGKEVRLVENAGSRLALQVDQVICGFNKTRISVNGMIRRHLGHGPKLQAGDRIICLKNNRNDGVFNGMQGTCEGVRFEKGRWTLDFRVGDREFRPGLWFDPDQFDRERVPKDGEKGINYFDFANVISAYKSQGDEWDTGLVLQQFCPKAWTQWRWDYTTASRFKKFLYWAVPKRRYDG